MTDLRIGQYLPEGGLIAREDNRRSVESARALEECIASKRTVEAVCNVCDSNHNLIVDFGFMKGIVPRTEGAIGIDDGSTRDIALISRVNKPICFKVVGFTGNPVSPDTVGGDIIRCDVLNAVSNDPQYSGMVLLSRKQAQVECIYGYINNLKPGDIIPSKITHLEQFGCFVDIACGLPSLIPIDAISVSRISHPSDRFYSGQEALTVVKSIDRSAGEAFGSGIFPKITLTHKELLGTWEQNAASFAQGETVSGIVRSVESYGVFVELLPNLAGLAELRENIRVNQAVSVYIKAIIPEKMKIKLIIVDSFDEPKINYNYDYLIESDRIDKWVYSTDNSDKIIKTDFV